MIEVEKQSFILLIAPCKQLIFIAFLLRKDIKKPYITIVLQLI
jgi:hypothetical protein